MYWNIRIDNPRIRSVLLRNGDNDIVTRLAFPHIVFVEAEKEFYQIEGCTYTQLQCRGQYAFITKNPEAFPAMGRLNIPDSFHVGMFMLRPISRLNSHLWEFPLTAHFTDAKGNSEIKRHSHFSADGGVCYSSVALCARKLDGVSWAEMFWGGSFKEYDQGFVKDWAAATKERGLAAQDVTFRRNLGLEIVTAENEHDAAW